MADKRPFDDLLDALQRAARAHHVFGDVIRIGDLEAVPVATSRVEIGLPPEGEVGLTTHLRVEGSPIGFLSVVDGRVTFAPIAAPPIAPEDPPRWVHEAFAHIDELADRLRRQEEAGRDTRDRCDPRDVRGEGCARDGRGESEREDPRRRERPRDDRDCRPR